MLQYITTLNLIRIAIKHKKKIVKILQNSKNKRLLVIFIKLNIIFGWSKVISKKKNYYNVYINILFYKKIVTLLKPSKQISIKYKKLNNDFFKINNSSIFLTTNKGILNTSDTLKFHCGGMLLFCLL